MATKLRLVFTITIVFFSFYGYSQHSYWKIENSHASFEKGFSERFDIKRGIVFTFEEPLFKNELKSISSTKKRSKIVYFPNGEGELMAFDVIEAPVMSPELAAKFPEIKSYVGRGLENDGSKIRFSVSHKGIQAMMVNTDDKGAVFLQKVGNNKYAVYKRENNTLESAFVCKTESLIEKTIGSLASKPAVDRALRKFRLAVAASGEYTEYHGGSIVDAMAAINATVTRINQVYETDLGISLELVANNQDIIYTDAATDPFGGNLNTEIQNTLTEEIGPANYDIGHLFHKGSNDGNAGFVGSVCSDNKKGSAYSSGVNPEGDIFDIDYVSHEMGHQFGANHTWSFESEGTVVQAEPGSGTTIMGYAGITGVNNVAPSGDDYFHYYSIVQISDYLETHGCGMSENLVNVSPEASDIGDFVIPKSTAFVLEGSATDANVDDVLTYTWEQIDNGVVTQATFGPTNPVGANFRSQKPSDSPIRYFPNLNSVLQGELTQTTPSINSAWETVSDVERDFNFAFTVRDNALGGGQVDHDLVKVSVVNGAGPFKVLSQAENEVLSAGTTQDIIWDVANTERAPVSATLVDIFLSTDGGLTFPTVLAQNTPNDGSHRVVFPGVATTQARIMVKASDNIFYAVNESDFTIEASEIVLNFSELEYGVCQPDNLVVPFNYQTYLGFNEEATFGVVSTPPGLNITFSPETAIDTDTPVEMTISDTQNLAEGNYIIRVLATSATKTQQVELDLNIYDTDFTDITLISPIDGLQDSSTTLGLEWQGDPAYTSYDVQIATDAAFTNIIDQNNVITSTYLPNNLQHETTYYWRVRPKNACGEGSFGAAFSFTTISFSCESISPDGLPLEIPAAGTPTITSKVAFFEDLILSDVNVNLEIEHTFLSDLVVSLTSPAGTTVVLISSSCGELKNINATFDDSGESFVCGGDPAISGTVKPLGSLNVFKGESILGEWILKIEDTAASDGGALVDFSLEVCVEGEFRPDADKDGVFDDGDDICLGTPEGAEVNSEGCEIFRFPSNNFSVELTSESCRNQNDGAIDISATLPVDYAITITGPGTDLSDDFTSSFSTSNLSAGTYNVCITGTEGAKQYEPNCFEVIITEPQPIGVSSKTDLKSEQITLTLEGAEIFYIELNGESIQTQAKEITLGLKDGYNKLKVSTAQVCQGIYEEEFFISSRPLIYPNPFTEYTNIFVRSGLKNIKVSIFTADGRLVKSTVYQNNDTETALNFQGLPSGMYYVKFEGPEIKMATKVIKQ
ncbi:reprolysin-like metallopeptidase [Maribacter algicola]|uniref:Reprolysin-like metallopeptidase n=1 Tax=Meishania litoralis TaxID=3434685 RepID=A0ACC7LMB0_9FLAO